MKKTLTLLNLFCFVIMVQAQVGINTTTPSNAAVLELNSYYSPTKYGGFMPPRVTEAQRNLIPVTAADDGLIAYVSFPNGDRCLQLYDGVTSTWESIKCLAAPIVPIQVFFEPINNVSGNVLATMFTGYSNYPACSFIMPYGSTPASVNNTSPSNTTGASGTGNFYFQTGANRSVGISGINLTSHTAPLTLSVLIYKSTQASTGSELTIEYYDSALATLVPITITNLPTGPGTEGIWYQRTLSTSIPNTLTEIRFRVFSANTCEFRIDDIKITSP